MPFGDEDYKKKVIAMDEYQLEAEKKMLTTKLAGGTTKTGLTLGLAVVCPLLLFGTAYSAARTADAAFKLDVVNAVMRARNCYKHTRGRDLALGTGITVATAGLAHGVSTLAHHAIADMHIHHPSTQQEKWICAGVEEGVEAGSKDLIYRGVRPGGVSDYDPDEDVRKICDGCFCMMNMTWYHCTVCADFDLCTQCWIHDHIHSDSHDFVRQRG